MAELENDRQLRRAFRQGQKEALTQVYRTYVDDVARLVERILPDPSEVRDMVQEVFIKAFSPRARHGYDGLRSYRPYIKQIARNALIDHLRQQGRQLSLVELDAVENAGDGLGQANAEEALHWHRLRQATQNYVNTLPEQLQQFVKLRFEQELSQRDIVAQLGLSRWQVRRFEKQVQEGLRAYLQQGQDTSSDS